MLMCIAEMSEEAEPIEIDLGKINECHDTLDKGSIGYFVAAAQVCIDRHHNEECFRPLDGTLSLDERPVVPLQIICERATSNMKTTHANDEDAAKDGAYAIMIVLAFRRLGLRVLGKCRTKLGADWVGDVIGATPPRTVLIEVSGMLTGDEKSNPAKQRLGAKIKQFREGKSGDGGLAFVVDFRQPVINILAATLPPTE